MGFNPKLNQGVVLPWLCTRAALTKATELRLLLFFLSNNHAQISPGFV